jgi:hypothetical protein
MMMNIIYHMNILTQEINSRLLSMQTWNTQNPN